MTTIYDGLNYSTKTINFNFKIKVSGMSEGVKYNTLVGVAGLIKLVGIEMANKMLSRAFRCMNDKDICKLRRGLKVSFYKH